MLESTESILVRAVGEEIGYGALMTEASRIWSDNLEKNGVNGDGAFAVGPCKSSTVACDHGGKPGYECDMCGGSGWITKGAKQCMDELTAEIERLRALVPRMVIPHKGKMRDAMRDAWFCDCGYMAARFWPHSETHDHNYCHMCGAKLEWSTEPTLTEKDGE